LYCIRHQTSGPRGILQPWWWRHKSKFIIQVSAELLSIKALSQGLVKGRIDEVIWSIEIIDNLDIL
jgi:hypothetical protein